MSTVSPSEPHFQRGALVSSHLSMLTIDEPVRNEHERKGAHVTVSASAGICGGRKARLEAFIDDDSTKLVCSPWPRHLLHSQMSFLTE